MVTNTAYFFIDFGIDVTHSVLNKTSVDWKMSSNFKGENIQKFIENFYGHHVL